MCLHGILVDLQKLTSESYLEYKSFGLPIFNPKTTCELPQVSRVSFSPVWEKIERHLLPIFLAPRGRKFRTLFIYIFSPAWEKIEDTFYQYFQPLVGENWGQFLPIKTELWDSAPSSSQSFCPQLRTFCMRLLLNNRGKTNLLHDKGKHTGIWVYYCYWQSGYRFNVCTSACWTR